MCCRLHIGPEPVDVDSFDPKGVTPWELPLGKLVFGRARSEAKTVAFLSVSLCQVATHACCARQARSRNSAGKELAFNSASSGCKVTGDIPQPGSTCLQQMRYNFFSEGRLNLSLPYLKYL